MKNKYYRKENDRRKANQVSWSFCKCCKKEVLNMDEHRKTKNHQLNELFALKKKIRTKDDPE